MWKVRIVSWVPGSPIDSARDDADRLAHVGRRLRQALQTPFLAAQVSTERIFTSWMPAALIAGMSSSAASARPRR